MRLRCFFVMIFYFMGFIKWGYCIDASEIIKKAKQKYESIESFSAEFKQIFKWKLAGETQQHNGKILLKELNKFRIETDNQFIISDGNTLWTYSKINNQVIIDNIKNAEEIVLPREIFLKFSQQYNPVLLRRENFNESECYVIHLIAKNENVFIREMKIWIDKNTWFTLKIEHKDINENVTIYVLGNIQINKKIDDKKFMYQPLNNVEIIDMR